MIYSRRVSGELGRWIALKKSTTGAIALWWLILVSEQLYRGSGSLS